MESAFLTLHVDICVLFVCRFLHVVITWYREREREKHGNERFVLWKYVKRVADVIGLGRCGATEVDSCGDSDSEDGGSMCVLRKCVDGLFVSGSRLRGSGFFKCQKAECGQGAYGRFVLQENMVQ